MIKSLLAAAVALIASASIALAANGDGNSTLNSLHLNVPLGAASGGTCLSALGFGIATGLGNSVTGSGGTLVEANGPTIANLTMTGTLTATGNALFTGGNVGIGTASP